MICGIGYAYIDTNSVPNVAPLRPIARRIGRLVSAQNKSGTVAASANRPASITPINTNLPSEPFLHNGKHIFVAKADHSHKGALHAGKAGNKDKGTEGVIVPRSKMIHGQIDN